MFAATCLTILLLSAAVYAAPAEVPRTGQTTAYYPGDDGSLQTGVAWPSPRFTVAGSGTGTVVTDKLTGLMWPQNAGTPAAGTIPDFCAGGQKNWLGALDYVTCLNTNNYLGHNDWRLPNKNELGSLLNNEHIYGLDFWLNTQGFTNVQNFYWSSTTDVYGVAAWDVYIASGNTWALDNTMSYNAYVLPVRDGQSGVIALPKTGQYLTNYSGDDGSLQKGVAWPSPRFNQISAQNGTVVADQLTGLVWTQDGNAPGPSACVPAATKNWYDALDYVACLNTNNYLGYNDWRMPNINELESLTNVAMAGYGNTIANWLNGSGFTNVRAHEYWSSSTYAGITSYAWGVEMAMGGSAASDKGTPYFYVWPVRGGQSGSFAYLTTSNSGTGTGMVTVDKGALIWSGNTGIASYGTAMTVNITAVANTGSAFTGWSGACTGTGACQVTMSQSRNVTATFALMDTTPVPFTFTSQTNVAPNSPITSSGISISGINAPASISISGGTYSINNGVFTSASGTVNNGDSVRVQLMSANAYSSMTSATLNIGGVNGTFSVTTFAAPIVTTGAASAITNTSATLNGTVSANGADTTVSFEYGPTTSYGSTVSGGMVSAGSVNSAVSASVSALSCNTTYHYRINAINSAGSVSGTDQSFITGSCPNPSVVAYTPVNGATTVPPTAIVTATFSEAMDPATITTNSMMVSRYVGIKQVAAGAYHTVAFKNDGTVVAWGNNTYGQSTVPVGLSGVIAIAAGGSHTVALKNDGTVVAWGYNSNGQTTVPAGLTGVTAIAAGSNHTVALKNDGTLVAWGRNIEGQTTVPAGLTGVTSIAAGGSHTVALKNDGTVVAWGDNYYGQSTVPAGLTGVTAIAAGNTHTVALKNDGTLVAWGNNGNGQTTVPAGLTGVTAIAAGGSHTVALKNDGTLVAWGDNYYGQTTVPAGHTGVTAIAAGYYHTVALKNDGTLVAWGYNGNGQTTLPAGLTGVTAIAAGGYYTLALKNDGTVVAWGDNSYGQSTVPAGLTGVTAIAAGYSHTVALKNDGTVVAWGYNSNGQSTVPAGLTGVTAIAAGGHRTLALKNDGTLVAWGDNSYGQSTVPAGLTGVTAIAAGNTHTVTLKNDGTLVAWGSNGNGQTTVPAGLTGVTAIAAGGSHTVALKNDGTLVAWGDNGNGQSTVPAGLSGVTAIAAGASHTVALKNDGTVVAWGWNYYGQTTVPAGLSGVTAIAAGYSHTVALKNDGTLVAWGYNYHGQTTVPSLYSAYDSPVSGTVSYNPATRTATFMPGTSLDPGTYHVTVAGPRSTAGLPLSAQTIWSFSVPGAAPAVSTGAAGNSWLNGAMLTGTVNPNGANTTVQFDYGTSTAYGSSIAAGIVLSAADSTLMAVNLTDLTCGTTYHYRISATNSAGSAAGADQFFTTSACPVTYSIGSSFTGSGTITTGGSFVAGSTVTFTIAPNAGYQIVDVIVDGASVGAVPSYTFNSVAANHTISASFALQGGGATPVPALGPWGVLAAVAGLGMIMRRRSNNRQG
jgi:alpha-tubulin suppressor-like RCC1 family protein